MRLMLLATALLSLTAAVPHAYVLCEGNFMSGNATLWHLTIADEMDPYPGNPVGDTGQSVTVHEDRLYAVMNGSGTIEVFDIEPGSGTLSWAASVSTAFSGPREMTVLNGIGYITQWYTASVGVLDLEALILIDDIPVGGMPEAIITDGSLLYVSITMNSEDWSSAEEVVVIDPAENAVIQTYNVGPGPEKMLLQDRELYIARTWYDTAWNGYAGTSLIDLDSGDVTRNDYGPTTAFGADLIVVDGTVYRTSTSGVVPLDEDLNVDFSGQIGDVEGVYSAASRENLIYLGITDDYLAPDQIVVLDASGETLGTYSTGAIPGSFAFWPPTSDCDTNGDLNADGLVDILDIVLMVDYILFAVEPLPELVCLADYNQDGSLDVADVIGWISIILGL